MVEETRTLRTTCQTTTRALSVVYPRPQPTKDQRRKCPVARQQAGLDALARLVANPDWSPHAGNDHPKMASRWFLSVVFETDQAEYQPPVAPRRNRHGAQDARYRIRWYRYTSTPPATGSDGHSPRSSDWTQDARTGVVCRVCAVGMPRKDLQRLRSDNKLVSTVRTLAAGLPAIHTLHSAQCRQATATPEGT